MAIYDTGKGFVLPDLTPTVGLDPIGVEYSAVEDALKAYTQVMDKENERQQEQLDRFTAVFDTVIGHPLDNEDQQKRFQEARTRYGLSDDAFGQVSLDMKNPAALIAVESGFRKLANSREYREIVREQMYAETFLDGVAKINDPRMRELAKKDYERYRQGKITGMDLVPGQYEPVDFTAEIGKKMAAIPLGIDQSLIQNGMYVQEIKRRAPQALQAVFDYTLKDPRIRNSMIAAGYITVDDAGNISWTPEGEAYKKALLQTYETEQIKLIQQRQYGGASAVAAPGNTFNATSADYGSYNAIASQINTYGVNLQDVNVQNVIRAQIAAEEEPSLIAFELGMRFGTDQVRALHDRYVTSGQGMTRFGSVEEFARRLATDPTFQEEILKLLMASGYAGEDASDDEVARQVLATMIQAATNYRPATPAGQPGQPGGGPDFSRPFTNFTAYQDQMRYLDPSMQPNSDIGPRPWGVGTSQRPPEQPAAPTGGGGVGFF